MILTMNKFTAQKITFRIFSFHLFTKDLLRLKCLLNRLNPEGSKLHKHENKVKYNLNDLIFNEQTNKKPKNLKSTNLWSVVYLM